MTPPTNPEPATAGGRRMAAQLRVLNLTHDPESPWPESQILAIEAAARAEALAEIRAGVEGLAVLMREMFGEVQKGDMTVTDLVSRDAVLALLPDPPK